MNKLEYDLARYKSRVQKITSHPDPSRLQSNATLYECEVDLLEAQINAWKNGNPPMATSPGRFTALLRAMGFQYFDLASLSNLVPEDLARVYFDRVKAEQAPDSLCDLLEIVMALSLKAGEYDEGADIPRPALVMTANAGCDPEQYAWNFLARTNGLPLFVLDVPPSHDDESLKYEAKQLEQLIEFAEETVPGVKYDESKLLELQEVDREFFRISREIYTHLKAVPCPLAPRDAFKILLLPSKYPNPHKYVQFLREFRDEVGERVRGGIAGVPNERLRLMWAISGPYSGLPFYLLPSLGVSTPIFMIGQNPLIFGPDDRHYGLPEAYPRKLNPLEMEIRLTRHAPWRSFGAGWVESVVAACREFKIDGVVHYSQVGCMATLGTSQLVREAVRNELGIPTLFLEGRQVYEVSAQEQEMAEKLNTFVEMCLSLKASR